MFLSKRPFVVDIREELLIVLSGGLDRRRRHGGRHQQVHDDRVELHDQEHEQGDARGRLELIGRVLLKELPGPARQPCVSLFYVNDIGSTGSRGRTRGIPYIYPPP